MRFYRPYCIVPSNKYPLNQSCPPKGHHSQNLGSTVGWFFLDWLKRLASPPNENHGSWNKLAPSFVTFNKHTVPTIITCTRIFSFRPLQVPECPPQQLSPIFQSVLAPNERERRPMNSHQGRSGIPRWVPEARQSLQG